jgi:hypothetical protein
MLDSRLSSDDLLVCGLDDGVSGCSFSCNFSFYGDVLGADSRLSGRFDIDNLNRFSGLLDEIDDSLFTLFVDDNCLEFSDELSGGGSDLLYVSSLEILQNRSSENNLLNLFSFFRSDLDNFST